MSHVCHVSLSYSLVSLVPWLGEVAALMRSELFKEDQGTAKVLAMTMTRGVDVSRCIQKYVETARAHQDETDDIVWLMRQCFQSDNDIEELVNTVQERYGPMRVYLTGDEKSSESLEFFQAHGYKTRLDSAVVRTHLKHTDVVFLDFLMCRNSTLYIGNNNNKLSKQILSLRDSVHATSFMLKQADVSE